YGPLARKSVEIRAVLSTRRSAIPRHAECIASRQPSRGSLIETGRDDSGEIEMIQLIRRGRNSWTETRMMMYRRTMPNGRRDRTQSHERQRHHKSRDLLESERAVATSRCLT